VTWEQTALTFNLGTAGVVLFADLTPPPLDNSEDFHGTAVLQRSIITFQSTQQDSVSNASQSYAIGMYVSTRAAILTPTVLAPLSNAGQDWLYWTGRSTYREADHNKGESWEIDLRSKRRLRGGYGLIMVIEPLAANTSIVTITVGARLLWAISN